MILVFPQLAPLILVLSEYFVLKDLTFYEVVCFTDTEARKARLDTKIVLTTGSHSTTPTVKKFDVDSIPWKILW